jgi:hypothetical protein
MDNILLPFLRQELFLKAIKMCYRQGARMFCSRCLTAWAGPKICAFGVISSTDLTFEITNKEVLFPTDKAPFEC